MNRLACILLALTILASGMFAFANVHAQVVNGGVTLNSNTEWTAAQGPINLNGTVEVNSNVTLTIDPGVTVNLGIYAIVVEGALTAQGNANNQIVFTNNGNQSIQTSSGAPIIFGPTSTPWNASTNSGSIIQDAVLDSVPIDLEGVSTEIDSCVFNYATTFQAPITVEAGSSSIISNNVINYNVQNYNYGVNSMNVYGGNPTIINNQFEGSFGDASNVGIAVQCDPVISGNTFEAQYGNNSYGIKVNSGSPQITGNQFEGNGWLIGVDTTANSAFTISNNIFSDCYLGVNAEAGTLTVQGNQFLKGTDGVDISPGAAVTVTDNLIDSNTRYGINGGGTITSNTISNNQIGIHNPPSGVISNNNIVGNTLNSITATIENVIAQNNWWGTTDTTAINQTIYDAKIDPHLGTVLFTPFLTQPSTSAPAIPSYTPTTTPSPKQFSTPAPTVTPVSAPTPTPYQYSQTFDYQVGSLINLNLITTAIALTIILAWVIVILGYAAKRVISKHWA